MSAALNRLAGIPFLQGREDVNIALCRLRRLQCLAKQSWLIASKKEKIQQITDRQIEKMADTRRQEKELQIQLGTCLQAGVSGSLLIALILVCAFDSDIAKRLKVLTANAELLALREPLKETF